LGPAVVAAAAQGVLDDRSADRYSIAYFRSPNPDRVIECLPSCTGADSPPCYPPSIATSSSNSIGPIIFHQKGHRSEAAAQAAE
jgi:isopenicillin N synthase-like dioxygenase